MDTPTKIVASKLLDKSQIFQLNHSNKSNVIGQIPFFFFFGDLSDISWDLSDMSWDLSHTLSD